MRKTALFKELEGLIDYIEDHIEEPLTLEQMAHHVSISKYHLTRVFKVMSHMSLMQYVRERKLAHSLKALIHSDEKVIDLAMRLGFEYEQSFIRAFKRAYNITPHQYRLGNDEVVYTKKINLTDVKHLDKGFCFAPEIMMVKPFEIAGSVRNIPKAEVDVLWLNNIMGFWNQYYSDSSNRPEDYWGIIWVPAGNREVIQYVSGINVQHFNQGKASIPSGLKRFVLRPAEYAVFKYIGNHGLEELRSLNLENFNKTIVETWLPSFGYSCRNRIHMILDRIPAAVIADDYCELHVYVPLEPSEQFAVHPLL